MMQANNRSRCGFTLAETLIAMLLMSFVGLIVTGGIAMGARVYGRIVERSNAELLLSTTLIELRDQLDRVEEVHVVGSGDAAQLYFRDSTSNWKRLSSIGETGVDADVPGNAQFKTAYPTLLVDGNLPKGIYLTEYKGYSVTEAPSDAFCPRLLLSDAAGGETLYATFRSIGYNSAQKRFIVTGLKVCKKRDHQPLAWVDRALAPDSATYFIRPLEEITQS